MTIEDLVTIEDRNTKVSEVYLAVCFLGFTVWSCGGRRAEVWKSAREIRSKFVVALREEIKKVDHL